METIHRLNYADSVVNEIPCNHIEINDVIRPINNKQYTDPFSQNMKSAEIGIYLRLNTGHMTGNAQPCVSIQSGVGLADWVENFCETALSPTQQYGLRAIKYLIVVDSQS